MTKEEAIEKLKVFTPMVVDDTREALDMAIEALQAEPVKHGEWKKVKGTDGGYTDFRCSNCRRYRFHNGEMLKKYLYCPNCGAKMDKD